MTTDQLTTLIRAAPFRPFVIHMAGGRKIPVPNPELIAHEPTSRIVVVVRPGDALEIIDLQRLSSLEVRSGPPACESDGDERGGE